MREALDTENMYLTVIILDLTYLEFFLKQGNNLRNNAFRIGKAKLGIDLRKESGIGHFEVVILQDILMAFYSALLTFCLNSFT